MFRFVMFRVIALRIRNNFIFYNEIFKRLKKVYGEAVIGYSTVEKWLFRIKGEEEDLSLSDPETNKEVEEHHRRLMLEILCYDRETDQRKS